MQPQSASRKLTKRTVAAAVLILLLIPATILFGIFFLNDRKYYFVSLLIILYSMVPFVLVFEKRKPQVRELMVIAVLAALAVAGRAAFFMVPQFKPVVAIVIIAGVCFGAESGFWWGRFLDLYPIFSLVRAPGPPGRCFVSASSAFWREFYFARVGSEPPSCRFVSSAGSPLFSFMAVSSISAP